MTMATTMERHEAAAPGVLLLLVHKGRSLLFHLGHPIQQGLGVQLLQPLPAVCERPAEADGRFQILPLPLQGHQMAAHTVPTV